MEFKIGDVVERNGVKMTVEHIGRLVRCVWFDAMSELHRRSFHANGLTKVSS
jgi:uncharacterized protein YodC (DUF2158 family)